MWFQKKEEGSQHGRVNKIYLIREPQPQELQCILQPQELSPQEMSGSKWLHVKNE